MKLIGLRRVKTKNLVLPEDFVDRLEDPRVQAMGESIKEHGLFYPPLVRFENLVVLDGQDRVAGHYRQGMKEIVVMLVECTDIEAEIIKRETGHRRRHSPEEQRMLGSELARLVEEKRKALAAEPPKPAKIGRPKTDQGAAVEAMAWELQTTPDAVRKAIAREEKRKEAEAIKLGKAVPENLELWGMPVHANVLAQVHETRRLINTQAKCLLDVQSTFTRMKNAKLHVPEGHLEQLRQRSQELAAAIRNSWPACLCAYCKGLPGVQERCAGCFGCGFLTKAQMESLPREYTVPGKEGFVCLEGRPVPVLSVVEFPEDSKLDVPLSDDEPSSPAPAAEGDSAGTDSGSGGDPIADEERLGQGPPAGGETGGASYDELAEVASGLKARAALSADLDMARALERTDAAWPELTEEASGFE